MILINNPGYIEFRHHERDASIYSIEKSELSQTIKEDNNEISKWVIFLLDKTWIKENILYELASIIQTEFPDNSISWTDTFFNVEKKIFLELNNNSNDTNLTNNQIDNSKLELENIILLLQKNTNSFEDQEIMNKVKNELIKYNLN